MRGRQECAQHTYYIITTGIILAFSSNVFFFLSFSFDSHNTLTTMQTLAICRLLQKKKKTYLGNESVKNGSES
uniref:Uncharacterized protein n=1 Tax=Anguilla anguilla TaxID=7936 RepID=A0A0E9WLB9_ANGAN